MTFNGIAGTTPREICSLFSEKFANVFANEELTVDQIELVASNVSQSSQSLGVIDIRID